MKDAIQGIMQVTIIHQFASPIANFILQLFTPDAGTAQEAFPALSFRN